MLRYLVILVSVLSMFGCSPDEEDHILQTQQSTVKQAHSYSDIRPIIEKKCVSCHSCFDAPCQLKLESLDGLIRGVTTHSLYDGTRKDPIQTTRLGIDALTESEWRSLNFVSLLDDKPSDSILSTVVNLGRQITYLPNSKLPDDIDISIKRDNHCAVTDDHGLFNNTLMAMPFAVNGLTHDEHTKLSDWLKSGAPSISEPRMLSDKEKGRIHTWETYLNEQSNERRLLSRWLYEHFYLARLYLFPEAESNRYFELIRSYTPSGQPILPVATRLPNMPAERAFYYRLRLVNEATVHKRHITLTFDDNLLTRINTLFNEESWSVKTLPSYHATDRSNPFLTFADLPAKARYLFMLEHAEYFVKSFVRGPVCRGQIATDVIRDRFWVMFQKPEADLYITDNAYQDEVATLLAIPGQDEDILEANDNWERFKTLRNQYQETRTTHYSDSLSSPASLNSVWQGNQNSLLTVFRHFDSASVRKGLIGSEPRTVWWIDFPLFERIYYELVVNFDVFGNVAHQLQTRLYFDLLRNGAEHNFLRLLPADQREDVLEDWYGGLGLIKTHITYAPLDQTSPTQEDFSTGAVKSELTERILERFKSVNAKADDTLNRCGTACDDNSRVEQQLARLTSTPFKNLQSLKHLPELTFLRVSAGNERRVFSLIRNRAHSNVAFLFGESLRHEPEKDTLTIYPGIVGSYPNFIFDVKADEIVQFVDGLLSSHSDETFEALTYQWGIRRTHPNFWDVLHDITDWHREIEPHEAGIFDINRYENL